MSRSDVEAAAPVMGRVEQRLQMAAGWTAALWLLIPAVSVFVGIETSRLGVLFAAAPIVGVVMMMYAFAIEKRDANTSPGSAAGDAEGDTENGEAL